MFSKQNVKIVKKGGNIIKKQDLKVILQGILLNIIIFYMVNCNYLENLK